MPRFGTPNRFERFPALGCPERGRRGVGLSVFAPSGLSFAGLPVLVSRFLARAGILTFSSGNLREGEIKTLGSKERGKGRATSFKISAKTWASGRMWRAAMDEQQVRCYGHSPRLRWAGIILACVMALATLQTIWKQGLRNWDWVEHAWLAAMAFWIASDAWQHQHRTWNWRSRLFYLGWGILFGVWIGHVNGWIPGVCIIALCALFAMDGKSDWSTSDMKRPGGVLELVLILIIAGWFVRTVREWIPLGCIVALMLFLASEKKGRRSMRENILRPPSLAWISTWGLAFYWAWREPTFASILMTIAILILWFGNLLMHLSPGERTLALSHPQS